MDVLRSEKKKEVFRVENGRAVVDEVRKCRPGTAQILLDSYGQDGQDFWPAPAKGPAKVAQIMPSVKQKLPSTRCPRRTDERFYELLSRRERLFGG